MIGSARDRDKKEEPQRRSFKVKLRHLLSNILNLLSLQTLIQEEGEAAIAETKKGKNGRSTKEIGRSKRIRTYYRQTRFILRYIFLLSSFHQLILSVPGRQRVQRFHQAEVEGYQRNRGQAKFQREVRVRE